MKQTIITGLIILFITINQAFAQDKTIRLVIVNTPEYTGLIDHLLEDFEKETGYDVTVYSNSDLYEHARKGEADILISHYGRPELEKFVQEGYGTWLRIVFANQAALIGPTNDPAGIKGMENLGEAFAKIAETKSNYIVHKSKGLDYLAEMSWQRAGNPEKGDWYIEETAKKGQLVKLADKHNAYFIWGAFPFLRFKEKHNPDLEILVTADPVLQRTMAVTTINPEKFDNINSKGAEELKKYLLSPETQAKVASFRSKYSDLQLWWPMGRHN